MEDVTGLGKLADSKVGKAVYDDALSPPMKEGGKMAEDLIKTLRLFTLPIQYFATWQDRLGRHLERVRNDVPPERQIEASPAIAGPILLALRYMEDDSLVTELFLNLLKRAIDRERVHEAHPAFPIIIEQLSPDEAMILYSLQEEAIPLILAERRDHHQHDEWPYYGFPFHRLSFPNNMPFYRDHLISLDLIDGGQDTIEISGVGKSFVKACVPEKIEGVAPFHLDNDQTEGTRSGDEE